MASNTHRDNAAARVALMEVMSEFRLNTIIKQLENISNPDLREAAEITLELKSKLAAGTAGEDPVTTFKEIGAIAYKAIKGLSELNEEDIFTINMIDPTVLENFAQIQSGYGSKNE